MQHSFQIMHFLWCKEALANTAYEVHVYYKHKPLVDFFFNEMKNTFKFVVIAKKKYRIDKRII